MNYPQRLTNACALFLIKGLKVASHSSYHGKENRGCYTENEKIKPNSLLIACIENIFITRMKWIEGLTLRDSNLREDVSFLRAVCFAMILKEFRAILL